MTNNLYQTGNSIQSQFQGGSYQNSSNWISYPVYGDVLDSYVKGAGRAMGVRSEYNLLPQLSGYPDSTTSFPTSAAFVKNQSWLYSTMKTQGFNPQQPYQTYYPTSAPNLVNGSGTNIGNLPVTTAPCGLSGYTKPIQS